MDKWHAVMSLIFWHGRKLEERQMGISAIWCGGGVLEQVEFVCAFSVIHNCTECYIHPVVQKVVTEQLRNIGHEIGVNCRTSQINCRS